MIRVIIESPYAGNRELNARYLNHIMFDCLKRGEAPIASHKLYTDILDDNIPDERDLGIEAGLVWSVAAQKVIIGTGLGISAGMRRGIERHTTNGVQMEFRQYGSWER